MAVRNRFLNQNNSSSFFGSAKSKRFRAMGGINNGAEGQWARHPEINRLLGNEFEMKVRAYRFAHRVDVLFSSGLSGVFLPPKMVSLAKKILRDCSPLAPGFRRKSKNSGFNIILKEISRENPRGFNSRGLSADSAKQFVEWSEGFFRKNAGGTGHDVGYSVHPIAEAKLLQTREQIASRIKELEVLQQQAWDESRRLALIGGRDSFEESSRLAQRSRDLRVEIFRLQQQGNNKN